MITCHAGGNNIKVDGRARYHDFMGYTSKCFLHVGLTAPCSDYGRFFMESRPFSFFLFLFFFFLFLFSIHNHSRGVPVFPAFGAKGKKRGWIVPTLALVDELL